LSYAYLNRDKKDGILGEININISHDQDSVTITYSDNGNGMSEQVIDHIFDPFFSTHQGPDSTGLGMYIIANTVTQQLGGNIVCDSPPNQGARFTIILPKSDSPLLPSTENP